MMKEPSQFDFWYAVSNTRVVLLPSRRLETFGTTILNYHMISELMDTVNKVRIREGRIQAYRPQIITPQSIDATLLEGFGQEAEQYAEWLKAHAKDVRILQYGFAIRKQEISEHVVSDKLEAVVERVEKEVKGKDDPMAAIVVGVEAPWEVCLLKMMVEISGNSFPGNVRELERRKLFAEDGGVTKALREEIEVDFRAASRDPALVPQLGKKLQKHGLFGQYEDRFFALVKSTH